MLQKYGKQEVLSFRSNQYKMKEISMDIQDTKITIDPKKLQVVDIKLVRPNTWNPKDKDTDEYKQVFASIKENGLMGFIVVRDNPQGESLYEIIDGEQRWNSCVEQDYTQIVIYNEGTVDDRRARELTVWWQAQVPFNKLSLAKMVTNMIEAYGDIHSYFNEKELADMQKLAKFNWDQYKPAASPPPPIGELMKNFMVQVTASQLDIIQQALEKARKVSGEDITDSKALEFICVEYLTNPEQNTQPN